MGSAAPKKKEPLFADREFLQRLQRLMLPIALQSLMLSAVAAADAVMLGRVEQNAMSAVSLATQIQFIQNMAVSAITGSCAILGAQYWGKKDIKTIDELFCLSLRLAGLLSLVFTLACELCPGVLMTIFTNEKALIDIGTSYLRIAGWSYLLTGICECYLSIMKVTDHVTRSASISSGAVVFNIALNAIFIFGLFGLPAMGANGAALATLLSRIIELIWAIVSSYQKSFLHPKFHLLFHKNAQLLHDFSRCALPLLGGALFWGIGFTSYTAVMGHMGTDAAAANSVQAVIRDLLCCLCNGVSSAGGILVGNELGRGDLEKGRVFGERLIRLSFLVGLVTALAVLLITPFVTQFMVLTDTARSILQGMMVILAVYMIGRCVNTIIINGVFAAGGDTLFDMYSLAVCMWGIAIPLSLLGAFVFHWPVLVVYACTCVDEVGKIPWVLYHNKKHKWVKDLTRERSDG